jgi:hypothetical protein
MIIVEKNKGTKIEYEVSETKITFADELTLNLQKYQKDDPEHKDICFDADGDLVVGTKEGRYYVAEIDIPAIDYEEQGEDDDAGLVAKPLDMDKVVLTLWSIDGKEKVKED